MIKPFILGFPPFIQDSSLMATQALYDGVGHNTGNLAFCHAIDKSLGGGLSNALWSASCEHIKTLGNIGIVTLSNQLGPHGDYEFFAKHFSSLDINLVGIGLGAQSDSANTIPEVKQGTLDWIYAIQQKSISKSPNIGVRGDFTLQVLEKYNLADKAIVIGCPTLFINPKKDLGKYIQERFISGIERIAVTAGHQRWSHLSHIEHDLVRLCSNHKGSYICQSPIEMLQLSRNEYKDIAIESQAECHRYIAPEMNVKDFISWANVHAISFYSTSAWMEYLKKFDFVVGTRIHGVMLALQSGVPALCIAHDSRTEELCETMKVPFVRHDKIKKISTVDHIKNYFSFDYEQFDKNRILRAKAYVGFLNANGLIAEDALLKLSENN